MLWFVMPPPVSCFEMLGMPYLRILCVLLCLYLYLFVFFAHFFLVKGYKVIICSGMFILHSHFSAHIFRSLPLSQNPTREDILMSPLRVLSFSASSSKNPIYSTRVTSPLSFPLGLLHCGVVLRGRNTIWRPDAAIASEWEGKLSCAPDAWGCTCIWPNASKTAPKMQWKSCAGGRHRCCMIKCLWRLGKRG